MADDELSDESIFAPMPSSRNKADREACESQIVNNIKDVRYLIREYPAEVIVSKYIIGKKDDKNEIYVPDYQRELIWPERYQSRFIESILIGLPIPYIFVADVGGKENPDEEGRLEIVDGVQRIRTLARFMTNELVLSQLVRLNTLNGFRFCDLQPSRQRRFRRSTLRLIELTEEVTEDVRREMFDRINSGSISLEAVEVRRGMEQGPFLELVTKLAADPLLHTLAPISDTSKKRFEYEELVTRFFAFLNAYQTYGVGTEGKVVKDFLLLYVKNTNKQLADPGGDAVAAAMTSEWQTMLSFVRDHVPDGFRKKGRGRKVPRVRFEAMAIGIALALREKPNLNVDPSELENWLESPEFKDWTTSDASNNRANVIGRMEFLRNKLIEK